MKDKFSEKNLVEDYFIEQLQEKGWKFVSADELERDNFEEPLLATNVVRAIKRINQIPGLTQEDINRALNELKLATTSIDGAKKILRFFKKGIPIKLEKEAIVERIQLFDYENVENNEFMISRQVNYQGRDKIRTDIMLYINGVPIVNIECKNPANMSESWFNAYRQIKDYENTVPELYKYVQIGVAAEAQAKYFPIVPWQENVWKYEWKEHSDSTGSKDSVDATISILSKDKLLDIIRNFLFFRVEMGNATKVITRYMQYQAANKIVNRVIDNLRNREDKKNGLIWHWQGSGKTLTMIFAANKLYYTPVLENPTLFFIVDRIDLERQLADEFNALDIVIPEVIGSVEDLKEVIKSDNYRGKRGVFITLIHKFKRGELKELQTEIEETTKIQETIMTRKNVIAFIDEAHRTQYGLLAAQMKEILKNAYYFALTGTPISKPKFGRDTYEQFSYLPEEPYLDRYFITESIKDGFTVKIVYQPRLENLHLHKDMLETFLESEMEEIPEEVREGVEEKTKKRLSTIKLYLENPNRIKEISKDISNHFKENFDGKFKAMVVAASRKACTLYKTEIDKYFPAEYSEVVMTAGRKDNILIQECVAEMRKRHGWKDYDDIKKDVIDKFKEEEYPRILIVTDMLLTGFDSPILQGMYLDKPLKEHRLLQAVARTNRPYRDIKEAGIIIDYVGILKEFKRALEIYNEDDIKGVLFSYENVRKEFKNAISELKKILKEVPETYKRDTLLKAVEVLTGDTKKEKSFVEKYKKLRKIFEILGPDEIKLKYFDDFKWLSAIYTFYTKMVFQNPNYERYIGRYFNRTLQYIYETTEIEKIKTDFPYVSFDEEYLKKLNEKVKGKKQKAANILFTLNKFVLVEKHRSPIYETLVERVERLLEMWKEKVKDYEKIFNEGVNIVKDINGLSARQRELDFEDLEYALLLTVEGKIGEKSKMSEEINEISEKLRKYMFTGWLQQTTVRKDVEKELRRFVRGIKARHNLTMEEMNNLFDKMIENVKYYGT
ncbi:HsdR family type I site-specific deoxyribonuclease [candidate division WOR-3 bacterium]|nr:HsdR family type I site-specific deoxyribonuclease [candidate division WOR-3 bacterium]